MLLPIAHDGQAAGRLPAGGYKRLLIETTREGVDHAQHHAHAAGKRSGHPRSASVIIHLAPIILR